MRDTTDMGDVESNSVFKTIALKRIFGFFRCVFDRSVLETMVHMRLETHRDACVLSVPLYQNLHCVYVTEKYNSEYII